MKREKIRFFVLFFVFLTRGRKERGIFNLLRKLEAMTFFNDRFKQNFLESVSQKTAKVVTKNNLNFGNVSLLLCYRFANCGGNGSGVDFKQTATCKISDSSGHVFMF